MSIMLAWRDPIKAISTLNIIRFLIPPIIGMRPFFNVRYTMRYSSV